MTKVVSHMAARDISLYGQIGLQGEREANQKNTVYIKNIFTHTHKLTEKSADRNEKKIKYRDGVRKYLWKKKENNNDGDKSEIKKEKNETVVGKKQKAEDKRRQKK